MSWRRLAQWVGRSVATVRRLVREALAQAPRVLQRLQEWWGELVAGAGLLPLRMDPPLPGQGPLGACLNVLASFRRELIAAHPLPAAAGDLDIATLLLQGDPAWL